MLTAAMLWVFVPTFVFVSATPGMCMTLSMTLGITVGLRRTLWMMAGELIGVGLVAAAAVVGVAAVMLQYPAAFVAFKWAGGAYLCYLGVQMWRSLGRMAIPDGSTEVPDPGRWSLAVQGFVTAVANPKGWAFFIALLPPFVDYEQPVAPQLAVLLSLILLIEFASLLLYASGGSGLRRFLARSGNVRVLNRIAGSLMLGVGIWLALS